MEIPSKFHNSIIGAKGRLIRAILEECSGVLIRFPPEGSSCDKVVIRGPIDDAENARRQLQELTSEKVSNQLVYYVYNENVCLLEIFIYISFLVWQRR